MTKYCLFIFLLFASIGIHAEVYKWTDADGNVHFGDKPNTDEAEKIKLQTKPADKADDYAERKRKQKKLIEVFASEAEDKKATEKKAEAEKKELKQKCAELQKDINYLAEGGRFYTEDEQGEYNFKSEKQIEERLNQLREYDDKYCK